MHPLLISLLDATANRLDGISHALRQRALRSPQGSPRPLLDGITRNIPVTALHGSAEALQLHHVPPLPTTADRGCSSAGLRPRLTPELRLRPGRPGQQRSPARHRSAPHDVCLTVISGRMNEVCDLLDQLVAREAMHS